MKLIPTVIRSFACLAFILFCLSAYAEDVLLIDDFENGLRKEWSAKSFKGTTNYVVTQTEGRHVLQATSHDSASGLIFEREFDVYENPVIVWSWKIDSIVEGGDYRQKSKDDFAARVYVTFPHWFFPNTTSLNYIWANLMPKEEVHPNAYTSNAMMLAVESGNGKAGSWAQVRRNIIEDYRRAFGEDPPRKAVIAIMTDTDNTGQKATAWYDDIYLSK